MMKPSLKRILLVAAVAGFVVGAVLAALPYSLGGDFARRQLQEAVAAATGRQVKFGGAPRLRLWPEGEVEFAGVELSNPPGMPQGQFASVETLRLRASALPLLWRKLEISEVALIRPRFNLLVDGEGRMNFAFTAEAAPMAKEDDPEPIPLIIEDGEVSYLDRRSGAMFVAEDVDLSLPMPAPSGPIDLNGRLTWNRQRVEFSLFVKSPGRLATDGSASDLTISSPLLNAAFSGRAVFKDGLSLAGQIDARAPSLKELAAWAGKPLEGVRGLEALTVTGALDLAGKAIVIKDARLTLDGMNGEGQVRLNLAGTKPMVAASLGLDRLNLDVYLPPPSKRGSALVEGWSDAPMSFKALRVADGDLSLAASEIVYGKLTIGAARVSARLRNGVLDAQLDDLSLYGGKGRGRILLDGSGETPTIRGTLTADGVQGGRLLGDYAGFGRIDGGVSLDLSLAATGATQLELVSTLSGTSRMKFLDGVVEGIDSHRMIAAVEKAMVDGWNMKPGTKTQFSELAATFTIADGVADTQDLKLKSPLLQVSGSGSIDLLRQRLDLKLTPKVAANAEEGGKEVLTGLPVPVVVDGPWTQPKIYPDIQGILQNPQAAYENLHRLMGARATGEGGEAAKGDAEPPAEAPAKASDVGKEEATPSPTASQ